jgi:putative restriction endonuclease
MDGYVANTDFEWYRFLKDRAFDEVNFWFPSGVQLLRRIQPGAPFFFKLKKPHYAVAGYGYFARSSAVPAWLAWESFDEKNGAADYEAFLSRIERYQPLAKGVSRGDQIVGCLMIGQPVFFEESDWIRQPTDWARQNVRGEYYDVTKGEGRRIYEECLARTGQLAEVLPDAALGDRYGSPVLVRPRLGQGTFRLGVTDAYSRCCAVTQEHSLPVLEAAHIQPYARQGTHDISNGLLLRVDIHKLFDRGYVTVTPNHRFEVSRRLQDDYSNGRSYYPLHGAEIQLPTAASERPSQAQLIWHNENVFRG